MNSINKHVKKRNNLFTRESIIVLKIFIPILLGLGIRVLGSGSGWVVSGPGPSGRRV